MLGSPNNARAFSPIVARGDCPPQRLRHYLMLAARAVL